MVNHDHDYDAVSLQLKHLSRLAACFDDVRIRRALEEAYFRMARFFQWPHPSATEDDWTAPMLTAMEMIRARSPELAEVYGERLDRWLMALIVQRWVPDEYLEASLRDELAARMGGIERLPDSPFCLATSATELPDSHPSKIASAQAHQPDHC